MVGTEFLLADRYGLLCQFFMSRVVSQTPIHITQDKKDRDKLRMRRARLLLADPHRSFQVLHLLCGGTQVSTCVPQVPKNHD
mmetsp:Transcript_65805/g.177138  ORF Transcript_65805/g.177138 Transcript_65805/m.177138 type:complete len:82 (-) Transcript_65805:1139-1384(-)